MPLKITDDILNNAQLSGSEKMMAAAIRQGVKFEAPFTVAIEGGGKYGISGEIVSAIENLHEEGLVAEFLDDVKEGEQPGSIEFRLQIVATRKPKIQRDLGFKEANASGDGAAPEEPRDGSRERFESLEVPADPNTIAVGPERFGEIIALDSSKTIMAEKPKAKGVVDIDGTEYVVTSVSEDQATLRKLTRKDQLELLPSESIVREFKVKKIEYVIVDPGVTITVTPSPAIPLPEHVAAAESLEAAVAESADEVVDSVAIAMNAKTEDELSWNVEIKIGEDDILAVIDKQAPHEVCIIANPGEGTGKQIFRETVESVDDGLALTEAKLRELMTVLPPETAPASPPETSAEVEGGGAENELVPPTEDPAESEGAASEDGGAIYFDFTGELVDRGDLGAMLDHELNGKLYRMVRMPTGATKFIEEPGPDAKTLHETHTIDANSAKRKFAEFLLSLNAPANESTAADAVDEEPQTAPVAESSEEAAEAAPFRPESGNFQVPFEGAEIKATIIADYTEGVDLFRLAMPDGKILTEYVKASEYAERGWETVEAATLGVVERAKVVA